MVAISRTSISIVFNLYIYISISDLHTWFLSHPPPAPSPSVSSPTPWTAAAWTQNPPEPASDSAPSAPAGSPELPSPSSSPVCGSPKPDGRHKIYFINYSRHIFD